MNPNEKDEEILMRLLDGDCDEREFALASERLRTEGDFLALYRRICEFEASVTELFPRLRIIEKGGVSDAPARVVVFPRKYWLPLATAAAAVLIIATILGLTHVENVRKDNVVSLEFSPSATMSFRPGETLPGTLPIGKTLRLNKGHMALSFQRGKARGVIESPAEFSVTARNELEFVSGKVFFDLAKGSQPIRCKAGGHLIEDIGTEFAFTVDEGDLSEVVVYDGGVRITELSSPAAEPVLLKKGSGLSMDELNPTPIDEADFTDYRKVLDRDERILAWNPTNDPGFLRWSTSGRSSMEQRDGRMVFSSEGTGFGWLMLNSPVPASGDQGFTFCLDAMLSSENARIVDEPAGVSLFMGETERLFIGKRHNYGRTWTMIIYPESGILEEGEIIALNVPENDASFRIHYEAETGSLEVLARTGNEWEDILRKNSGVSLAFDRIRLKTESTSFHLREMEVFSEK